MKHAAAASLLTGALLLVAAAPSHAGGRVFISGPGVYWGAPYAYPYPYYYPYPSPYYSAAKEAERRAMAQVRLTTEEALLSGCTRLSVVTDNSAKDMRRKIVRAGGNAAVVSFPADNPKMMQADVYRVHDDREGPVQRSPEGPVHPSPAAGRTPPPPPPGPRGRGSTGPAAAHGPTFTARAQITIENRGSWRASSARVKSRPARPRIQPAAVSELP